MIKRLRERKNWSQEQLAIMSGLSVRTIQRIESGNKASLESLKSLAAVFEVDISKLTEEIIVIDKDSQTWKAQPWWFRYVMWGVNKRKPMIQVEYVALAAGLISWLIKPDPITTPALFLCAYLISKLIYKVDKQKLW